MALSSESIRPFLHLVLGGARSGKSKHAERLATDSGLRVCYVATYATGASDPEMQERVRHHVERRPKDWKTIENQFDLAALVQENEGSLLLVDCLTLWLSYHQFQNIAEEQILEKLESALRLARDNQRSLILVSNELGMGLVPSTPEGRHFRDLCGRANQLAAKYATTAELMVAGLPLLLKGTPFR